MKIRTKLALPLIIVSLLLFTLLFFLTSWVFREYQKFAVTSGQESLLESYRRELRAETEMAASLIQTVYRDPELSPEEKLERARETVRPLRFGTDGYFYAYQSGNGLNLIHGSTRANEGKILWDLQSPDKKQYIIRDLDRAAADGSLFVSFYWSKPGEDPGKVFPKLGTALLVPGTDIWVGTGAYIDDIDRAMEDQARQFRGFYRRLNLILLVFLGGAPLLLFALVVVRIRRVVSPVSALSRLAADSEGTDFSRIPTVTRRRFPDEITVLETSFADLFRQFSRIIREIQQAAFQSGESQSEMRSALGRIGESLEQSMVALENLTVAEKQVSREAEDNRALSRELEQFIGETGELTEKQNGQVETAGASIRRINGEIASIAENAVRYNRTAREMDTAAREGAATIQQAVRSLEEAERAAATINEAVNMITNITDRTNILAINASIEAARAGEVGRGFAVVANEVRTLAKSSSDSVERVSSHLQSIAQAIDLSRQATGQASGTFLSMKSLSGQVLEGMDSLNENSLNLRDLSREVESVLDSLSVISGEVRTSSSEAHGKIIQLSRSASDLAGLSENLQGTVQGMREHLKTISSRTEEIIRQGEQNSRKMEDLSSSVARFRTAEESSAL